MAGKVKGGGLGKTARSSTLFNRKEGPSGHNCENCTLAIKVKDLVVVKTIPGNVSTFLHRECYSPISPPGKSADPEHSEGGQVRKKQTAWKPQNYVGRRAWETRQDGHKAGYDKNYGYGHLA